MRLRKAASSPPACYSTRMWRAVLMASVSLACALCAQDGPRSNAPLSRQEILERVDDATASELRFVLNASFFSDDGIGFDGALTRSAIAYRRLLAMEKPEVFELLCRCTDDVPAFFGVWGLLRLDSKRLRPLLLRLVTRREPIQTMSGCVGLKQSIAQFVLQWPFRKPRGDEFALRNAMAEAWVHAVKVQGAKPTDQICAELCGNNLPALAFKRPFIPDDYVLDYIVSFQFSDLDQQLRYCCSEAQNEKLRELFLDFLASRALSENPLSLDFAAVDWFQTDIRNRFRAWLVVAAARVWQRLAPLDAVPSTRIHWNWFADSPWRNLQKEDWGILELYPNDHVRAAAKYLRNHPLISFKPNQAAPATSHERRIWLFAGLEHALEAAKKGDAAELEGTFSYLADHPTEFPFIVSGRSGIAYYVPEALELPEACLESYLRWMLALCSSETPDVRTAAYRMCLAVSENRHGQLSKAAGESVEQILRHLEKDCQNPVVSVRWQARKLWLALHKGRNSLKEKRLETAENWARELAMSLVDNPRLTPVGREFRHVAKERDAALLAGILEGCCHFVPDEEWDTKSEPETNSPDEIFVRMKAALAKLK